MALGVALGGYCDTVKPWGTWQASLTTLRAQGHQGYSQGLLAANMDVAMGGALQVGMQSWPINSPQVCGP